MALPIISWYDQTNTTEKTSWPIGTVDASSYSDEFVVLIWNNRGGANPNGNPDLIISDMQNVTITTKDVNGGNTGALVTEKWIQAYCTTKGENQFPVQGIGGDTTHPIGTTGTTTNTDGTHTPNQGDHVTDSGTVDILGVWNDHDLVNAAGNFAKVHLRAYVPATANAGVVNFLTRVAYQWV